MFDDKEKQLLKSMLTKVYLAKYSLILAFVIWIIHMLSVIVMIPLFHDFNELSFARMFTVPLLLVVVGACSYWSNFFRLGTIEWIDMELRFNIYGDISFTDTEREIINMSGNGAPGNERIHAPNIYVHNGVSAVLAAAVSADVLNWAMKSVSAKVLAMAKMSKMDIPEKNAIRRVVIIAFIIAFIVSNLWAFILV